MFTPNWMALVYGLRAGQKRCCVPSCFSHHKVLLRSQGEIRVILLAAVRTLAPYPLVHVKYSSSKTICHNLTKNSQHDFLQRLSVVSLIQGRNKTEQRRKDFSLHTFTNKLGHTIFSLESLSIYFKSFKSSTHCSKATFVF